MHAPSVPETGSEAKNHGLPAPVVRLAARRGPRFTNDQIMRTFVRLRQLLVTHEDLARKLEELEQRYDGQFRVVFEAIRQLLQPPPAEEKSRIGFRGV